MPNDSESVKLLRELVRLTRVAVYPTAKRLLEDEFFEDGQPVTDRVLVYANLDGASQRAVAKKAGVNQSSVSRWSAAWKRTGLVTDDGKAVFNIYDYFPELEEKGR